MLLPPLVTGLVWIYLGNLKVLNLENLPVPYPVYVLTGLFFWQSFVEALNCPLQQLQGARGTLSKVRIPHEAFIIAGFASVILNLIIRLAILVIVLIFFKVPFHNTMLLVPFSLGALLLFGIAFGWLIAPLGMLYADVNNALQVLIGIWFLITPVVYTPPASVAGIIALNPVTPLLTTTRNWLLTGQLTPAPGFALVIVVTGSVLAGGWLIYRLARPHLVVRM
jgi:lipopolysaccharide transport system permease protein